MSEISLSERDCLIRRLQYGEKHNRKVTDRKFYRRLLNHIASLEAQLAARNQAAEALREAVKAILENEMPDYKAQEEFGGYVLDDSVREKAKAALREAAKGGVE